MKLRNLFANKRRNFILGPLVFLSLIVVVGVLVIKSAGDKTEQIGELPTTGTENTHVLNVLAITLNPVEDGVSAYDKFYKVKPNSSTAQKVAEDTFQRWITDFSILSQGRIRYSIKERLTITTFPTYIDGALQWKYTFDMYKGCTYHPADANFNPACSTNNAKVDYIKWLNDNKIAEIVNAKGIDEIWLVNPPYIINHERKRKNGSISG